jgi:hypothetical protein
MAGTTRVTVVIKCKWGPRANFSFHVASTVVAPDDPIVTGLITVLEAITRGKAVSIEISLSAANAGSATSAVYYKSEDKALMRFIDDNGTGHAYKLSSFKAATLEGDRETIDPANSFVIDFTDAVVANARTRSGDLISAFISGHRTENRNLIKAGRV